MKKIFFVAIILCLITACKKNQLGGKSTIEGKVAHHNRPIPYAVVYIKFDAKEFPGKDLTKYDDKVNADGSGNYAIKCYKGDYYLYGVGFDDELQLNVFGGTPVHVRNKESVSIDVAVTE